MLNETQRKELEAYLLFPLADIMENDDVSPAQALIAMQALYEIFDSGRYNLYNQHRQTFNTLDILDTIDEFINIYRHLYPQNRTTNYPYFQAPSDNTMIVYKKNGVAALEQKGLLSLSARNDNTTAPVTKADVIRFIRDILRQRIELLKKGVEIHKLKNGNKLNKDKLYAQFLQSQEYEKSFSKPLSSVDPKEALKKQAEKNYNLAKAAIFRGAKKEAIDLLFLVKSDCKKLKVLGVNVTTMLDKVKRKLDQLKPRAISNSPIVKEDFSLKHIKPFVIKTFKEQSNHYSSPLCFSPCGNFFVKVDGGFRHSTEYIISMVTIKNMRWSTPIPCFGKIKDVFWSLCGNFFVVVSQFEIEIFKTDTWKKVLKIGGFCDDVTACISPFANFLAYAATYGNKKRKKIKIWDINTGKQHIKTLKKKVFTKGHSDSIESLCFSPCENFLASGGKDKNIIIWGVSTGKVFKILKGHSDCVQKVCFSPSGEFLASISADKTIKIWSVKTWKEFRTIIIHDAERSRNFDCIRFSWSSCSGFIFAVISIGRYINFIESFNIKTKKKVAILENYSGNIHRVCFNYDGTLIISGSQRSDVLKIWKIAEKVRR